MIEKDLTDKFINILKSINIPDTTEINHYNNKLQEYMQLYDNIPYDVVSKHNGINIISHLFTANFYQSDYSDIRENNVKCFCQIKRIVGDQTNIETDTVNTEKSLTLSLINNRNIVRNDSNNKTTKMNIEIETIALFQ